MKKKAAAMTLFMVLLFTATAEAIIVHSVKADPYIAPEQAPSGYRIYSNGTFDVPNLRRDGDLYTLTGNINGTIVIERNSTVLDGAGHGLQGKGDSTGVWLQDRSAVTIRNLNISNFDQGIRFSHYAPDWHSGQTNPVYTTNCTIQSCNITNNHDGISFYWGVSNCNILDNYVANNVNGIVFSGSGNTFRNNKINMNQYDFWDQDDGDNDVDISNTVNGKPIIYWVDKQNATVPQNAGLVILKKCEGIRVQNLNLAGHGVGLMMYYTNDSKIIGNNITSNYWRGISIWWSNNNSLTGNYITDNANDGIEEYESHGNTVSHNLIKANQGSGIYHRYLVSGDVVSSNQIIANKLGGIDGDATNCTITDNFVFENAASGISVDSNCIVARNNITSNGPITSAFQGAGLGFRNNCTITDNYISKNNRGIWTYDGKGNTMTGNTIAYNNNEGIRFQGPAEKNSIYCNNFIENNNNGAQATVNNVFNDPAPNAWDNGTQGNYWSNYKSAPYVISDKNQDNHPLLTPKEVAPLELPSIPSLAIGDTTPKDTDGTKTETSSSFPVLLIVSIAVAIVLVGIGLLVYFKKRKP